MQVSDDQLAIAATAVLDTLKSMAPQILVFIEHAAVSNWERANPGKDGYLDNPGVDWKAEGCKLLATAALSAI